MSTFRHASLSLVASGMFVLGLFPAASASANEVMLINAKTGKCLTIAGGRSTDNNHEAVQFDCDRDPSRRWMVSEAGGVHHIRNVQTGKCLTIAGGRSTDNNV